MKRPVALANAPVARMQQLARSLPLITIAGTIAVLVWHHLPGVLTFWWAMLRWPFPTQGSESLIVWEASRLARGEPLYVSNTPDAHAFVSGPYTPLYFVAVAITLKLTPTIYTGGRIITLGCWLLLLALVALLVMSATGVRRGWLGALTAVALLGSFTPGVIWAARVKPTIPALALGALGLLIVQRTWSAPGNRVLWALVPLVAAYFTKQTTIAPALAAVLFLFFFAGWRLALRFVLVGVAGSGLVFLSLTLATRGQFFQHIILDRRLAWQEQLVQNFGGLFLRGSWPLMLAAILAVVLLALARAPSVAPPYLLAALAISWTIGIEGADHDHLIELALAVSLVVGTGVAIVAERRVPGARKRVELLGWPLAALLLLQLAVGWTPDRWYAGELTVPGPAAHQQLALIVNNIRNTPGEILAEEIGLIMLAGKPVLYDDPQAMAALARVGRWDQRQLLDDLQHRRFSLVILPANPRDELWTPEVLAVIHANYDLKFRDIWFTYEAKR